MSKVVSIPNPRASQSEPSRPDDRLSAFKTLVQATLSREEQQWLLRELSESLGQGHPLQAGTVLKMLRRVLPNQHQWTVAQLKQRIDEEGVSASAKELYNALNYLNRTGQVSRVGYGQYMVAGGLLVTADDLGGERSRHEDLSDEQPADRAYKVPK